MKVRSDIHIHTVISPCATLGMSPSNIVEKAKSKGLGIIGISDHNSTKHAALVHRLAAADGIYALMGAEVTTKEEVHCLCFFPDEPRLLRFQKFIDDNLPHIPLDVERFGHQLVVDEHERIIEELPNLLITALESTIGEVEDLVHTLGGLFIPAHINKYRYSIISQLGFVPFDLACDALEVTSVEAIPQLESKFPHIRECAIVVSSDAHDLLSIGKRFTTINVEELSFEEIQKSLKNKMLDL